MKAVYLRHVPETLKGVSIHAPPEGRDKGVCMYGDMVKQFCFNPRAPGGARSICRASAFCFPS